MTLSTNDTDTVIAVGFVTYDPATQNIMGAGATVEAAIATGNQRIRDICRDVALSDPDEARKVHDEAIATLALLPATVTIVDGYAVGDDCILRWQLRDGVACTYVEAYGQEDPAYLEECRLDAMFTAEIDAAWERDYGRDA